MMGPMCLNFTVLDYWNFNQTAMQISNISATVSKPAMAASGMPIQLNMVVGGRDMVGSVVANAAAYKLW